jgi:integrase
VQDAETLIAAIHRDWGEAQGNYDEFRFFTGLRPSEQIALVVSDLDVLHGVISINKARVAGIDRNLTKTGNDRRVELCPRALAVLKRQLRLREISATLRRAPPTRRGLKVPAKATSRPSNGESVADRST